MEITINWWTIAFITAASVVIWWGVRWSINRVTTRFDTLIIEVQKLGKSMIHQQGRIRTVEEKQGHTDKRLNNHANRIRNLELGKVLQTQTDESDDP